MFNSYNICLTEPEGRLDRSNRPRTGPKNARPLRSALPYSTNATVHVHMSQARSKPNGKHTFKKEGVEIYEWSKYGLSTLYWWPPQTQWLVVILKHEARHSRLPNKLPTGKQIHYCHAAPTKMPNEIKYILRKSLLLSLFPHNLPIYIIESLYLSR